jgi:hypothetical protein
MTDALWKPTTPTRADRLVLALPFAVLLLTLLARDYSYFIDEFYYVVCAKRLAFGYVDHPPLAPVLLELTRPAQLDPSRR